MSESFCPSCNSQTFTLGSGTATHYASLRCSECDRFIRWLPHPKTYEAHGDENVLIDKLIACDQLNPWERKFCLSIKNLKKRTPKQRAKLNQIANRLKIKNLTHL